LIVQSHATDYAVLIIKLYGTGKVAVSLINNHVKRAYTGYDFRVSVKGMNIVLSFYISIIIHSRNARKVSNW